MSNLNKILWVVILFSSLGFSQSFKLKGTIHDDKGGKVSQAYIYIQPYVYHYNMDSTKTDSEGNFNIPIKEIGNYILNIYKDGYKDSHINLHLREDIVVNIILGNNGLNSIVFQPTNSISSFSYQTESMFYSSIKIESIPKLNDYNPNKPGQYIDYKTKWSNYTNGLFKTIQSEPDSIKREILSVALIGASFDGFLLDSNIINNTLDHVPSNTYFWSYHLKGLIDACDRVGNYKYLDMVINNTPDRWTRAWLMMYSLQYLTKNKDTVTFTKYYTTLQNDYKNTDFAKLAKAFATKK